MILAVCLYIIAIWFAAAAIGLVIAAANRPGFRTRAVLVFLAAMAGAVAVVQVIAAGDLK